MKTRTLLDEVKQKLIPNSEIKTYAIKMKTKVDGLLRKKKIDARCELGGSIAKDTHLKGDADVDIFVRFDERYAKKPISDLLEKAISSLTYERVHGSRDYFQIRKNNILIELVPVIKIEDPKKAYNITDASPLHVHWVTKHLTPGQHDEIRLLKKFCKAARVYGAESYIRGFSGHVIDILIVHYGDFLEVLNASKKWKAKTVIDTCNHYKRRRDVLFGLNQSKIQGPMIVIDPINKHRNAASALSASKFKLFKKTAAKFLRDPAPEYFEEVTRGLTYIKKNFDDIFIIKAKATHGKRDVVGSRILKQFRFTKRALKKAGFDIKTADWSWNMRHKVLMWFAFKQNQLPRTKIIQGPPIGMQKHVQAFKAKYDVVEKIDGHLQAIVKIQHRTPEHYIKTTLNDSTLDLIDIFHHKT